jgi:DNA-binding NarL/FixJ family response regulator
MAASHSHRYMPQSIPGSPSKMPTPADLTAREIQVLQLVAQGHQNKEIAYALNIAEETAKIHVKHIFSKLGVQNRTQAVAVALHRGILLL